MRLILHPRSLYLLGGVLILLVALFFIVRALTTDNGDGHVTGVVSVGTVSEIVSVSGLVEAENTAELSFPVSDVTASVSVSVGDTVSEGDVLATLVQDDLLAERADKVALLEIARADRDELIAGPRSEARDVSDVAVQNADTFLARTITEQNEKVESARRALLSSDLEVLPRFADNDNEPPTVSGTYTCTDTGTYFMDVSASNAKSGYSFRISNLETGTYPVSFQYPTPLGECGLSIQFANSSFQGNADWKLDVPNMSGASYTENQNAYNLALQTRENTIKSAEEALLEAEKAQTLENASPRDEALRRANASVAQREAQLRAIDVAIEERTLRAPFDGTVTEVDIVKGETAGTEPVVTLSGNNTFTLTARIPEIDIAKMTVGQSALVIFDALQNETIPATVSFVSPLATEIDGVAYFKAKLSFENPPSWLREGLNADIDIIVTEKEDALRIPKRFLIERENLFYVFVLEGKRMTEVPVRRGFVGNDGFVEIIGLTEGDVVVAP